MKRVNYSIRCTKEQQAQIQKFAKEMDNTVVNSIITAIEQYNRLETISTIDDRIKELSDKLDGITEQYKGLSMFKDK